MCLCVCLLHIGICVLVLSFTICVHVSMFVIMLVHLRLQACLSVVACLRLKHMQVSDKIRNMTDPFLVPEIFTVLANDTQKQEPGSYKRPCLQANPISYAC